MDIHEVLMSNTLFSRGHTLKEIINRMLFNKHGAKTMKLDMPDVSRHQAQTANGLQQCGLPKVSLLNPLAKGLPLLSSTQDANCQIPVRLLFKS